METLMWLLINVAALYLMIHYGGSHASAGSHTCLERTVSRDPVCGRAIAAEDGYTRAYNGREHHFCSRACRMLFEQNPDRYLIEKRMAS